MSSGGLAVSRSFQSNLRLQLVSTSWNDQVMAIYHLSIKIISRGKGKSAVAAAAYRAGETITNEYDGVTHDYTRKAGIVHTEILLPENAPREFLDRGTLWNSVEQAEKACNAQLAREIEIALPVELSQAQNIELMRYYIVSNFVSVGMCADLSIHDKGDGNPHAHILLTMRPLDEQGAWAAKSRKEYLLDDYGQRLRLKNGGYRTRKVPTVDWNEWSKAEDWRQAWAFSVNAVLTQMNQGKRIDHRSYLRQGIDQIPTVHLGVAATQMERRGLSTDRGRLNRMVEINNQELRRTKARISKLRDWLKAEAKTSPPTLTDVLSEILSGKKGQGYYGKIRDLKKAAEVFNFMMENNLRTLPELQAKVKDFSKQLSTLRDCLKPIERRLKTLDEHLRQAEMIRKYRPLYQAYLSQKPKAKETFYESHRAQLMIFEAADRYMREHLNGRTVIPVQELQEEKNELIKKKSSLISNYQILKSDVRNIENILESAEMIDNKRFIYYERVGSDMKI